MYTTSNVTRAIIQSQHNLNSLLSQTKRNEIIKQTVTRHRNISSFSFPFEYKSSKLLNVARFLANLKKFVPARIVPETLKDQSGSILRVWTHQCENVLAQRLRRGQQMFCLYSRIWEERALRDLLANLQRQLAKRSKELLFSAVGVTAFNWQENRIPKEEFAKPGVLKDLDYIQVLFNETLVCKCCNKRILVDSQLPNVEYCNCRDISQCPRTPYDGWVPFIDREDLLVWRKRDPSGPFQYKMYGKYNDVTAIDFLNVQIDIEYRQAWDKSAIDLKVIETDPEKDSNSDLVYWEMEWPRFFSNRDYVFKRRYHIDCDHNLLFMMSISTHHPSVPEKSDKFRIKDYWSVMVIRPLHQSFEEKGIEFTLTYFDNPGLTIPQSVNTWVSMRAMPDFLLQLRKATKKYHKFRQQHGHKCPCTIEELVRQYREHEGHGNHNASAEKRRKGEENNGDGRPSGTHADVRLLNEIFSIGVDGKGAKTTGESNEKDSTNVTNVKSSGSKKDDSPNWNWNTSFMNESNGDKDSNNQEEVANSEGNATDDDTNILS